MHKDSTARTMAEVGAHQRRPRHDMPSWARLHWRERVALTAEGVTRAEWSRLPGTLRAELLTRAQIACAAGEDAARASQRIVLRRLVHHLPLDHPRYVLERRTSGLRREANAEHLSEGRAGAMIEALYQLAAERDRYAATVDALAVLILAAVEELLEVRDAAPRTGPQHRRTDPPEPPPPEQALTLSTLTAAPPAAAMSVPSTRCVVTLAA